MVASRRGATRQQAGRGVVSERRYRVTVEGEIARHDYLPSVGDRARAVPDAPLFWRVDGHVTSVEPILEHLSDKERTDRAEAALRELLSQALETQAYGIRHTLADEAPR
jgi:hypothetical protein